MSLWLHKSSHHPQCSEELCFLWFGCRVSEECRYYGVIWTFPSSNTVNVVTMQRKAGTTILSKGNKDLMNIFSLFYFFLESNDKIIYIHMWICALEIKLITYSHFTTAAPWQRSMIMKNFCLAPHTYLHKHTQAHHLFQLLWGYHAKQDHKISKFALCLVLYMSILSSPKGTLRLCDNDYISLLHDALCGMPVM